MMRFNKVSVASDEVDVSHSRFDTKMLGSMNLSVDRSSEYLVRSNRLMDKLTDPSIDRKGVALNVVFVNEETKEKMQTNIKCEDNPTWEPYQPTTLTKDDPTG